MITERTLRKWRKEALKGYQIRSIAKEGSNAITEMEIYIDALQRRILTMSQELLDQHLLRRK